MTIIISFILFRLYFRHLKQKLMEFEGVEKLVRGGIALDYEKSKRLAEDLNDLLAAYQRLYIDTRRFHWNITGDRFFELHLKFEELYTDALVKVDEIIERIKTLHQTPVDTFPAYLKRFTEGVEGLIDSRSAIKVIVSELQVLLEKERSLLKLSDDAHDEATVALMRDYIREQEKLVWMYCSFFS